jgi:hypothetical protein
MVTLDFFYHTSHARKTPNLAEQILKWAPTSKFCCCMGPKRTQKKIEKSNSASLCKYRPIGHNSIPRLSLPPLCVHLRLHVIFALLLLSIRYRDPRFLPYIHIQRGVDSRRSAILAARGANSSRSAPPRFAPAETSVLTISSWPCRAAYPSIRIPHVTIPKD